jgi:hypothetical protein
MAGGRQGKGERRGEHAAPSRFKGGVRAGARQKTPRRSKGGVMAGLLKRNTAGHSRGGGEGKAAYLGEAYGHRKEGTGDGWIEDWVFKFKGNGAFRGFSYLSRSCRRWLFAQTVGRHI